MHTVLPAEIIGTADTNSTQTRTQHQADPVIKTNDIQQGKQEEVGDNCPSGEKDILSFKPFKLHRRIYPPVHGVSGRHMRRL